MTVRSPATPQRAPTSAAAAACCQRSSSGTRNVARWRSRNARQRSSTASRRRSTWSRARSRGARGAGGASAASARRASASASHAMRSRWDDSQTRSNAAASRAVSSRSRASTSRQRPRSVSIGMKLSRPRAGANAGCPHRSGKLGGNPVGGGQCFGHPVSSTTLGGGLVRSTALVGVALALAACSGSGGPVVLGLAGPFGQPRGASMLKAAQLAVNQINAKGGLHGRPLELRVADDSGSEDVAVRIAAQLYADPAVVAVIGHLSSGTTLAAARVYGAGATPVVMISPSASSPDLSGISPYVFRVCPSDLQHAPHLCRGVRAAGGDGGGGRSVRADDAVARAVSVPHAAGRRGRAAARGGATGGRAGAAGDAGAGRRLAGARRRRAHRDRSGRPARRRRPAVVRVPAGSARRAQRGVRHGLRARVSGRATGPSRRRRLRCRVSAGARRRRGRRRPAGDSGLPGGGGSRPGGVRRSDGRDRVRHERGRPGEVGGDRRGARRTARRPSGAVMRGPLDTIRARILLGLVLLMAGLVATAIGGATTLRRVRRATADELAALRTSTEIGSGLVTSVLEEIRAAEQYLATPGTDARRLFDASAEEAFDYERRLAALGGLVVEDRLAINRLRHLHATIETEYAIAHALTDLGRQAEAVARVSAVRPQAAELTRLVRDLSRRQADKATQAAERLAADSIDRERKLWVLVVSLLLVGFFLSRYTLQSVQGPLGRLVTAAERFGGGDLRPVTTGEMPREFRLLAEAMQRMGDRLRHIVGDVIGESDRIAGSAGDLSAVSEQLAASSSQVSTAMVEISSGADEQRAALGSMGTGIEELRKATAEMAEAADRAAQLAELSTSIDDFVELIKRISSQTNLLALNAAIEAARAGEHGKGFAVVAEEVRQLADESARAAEEVTRTTGSIREQMEDVTATMAAGQAKVRGIESVAEGAAHGLGEIATAVELVEQAAARVRVSAQANRETTALLQGQAEQVATRATAHAAGAEQVTAATEQQGASTQQMAAAASSLLEAAEKLRGLVRGFRV